MLNKFRDFVRYDNTVPIFLVLIFIGSASVFAAPQVGSALISSTQKVVSVDNGYLVGLDVNNFNPKVTITSVSEDTDNFYVRYNLETVGIKDSSWQPIVLDKSLTVSKNVLGKYTDLGLFVAKELGEVVSGEKEKLFLTQNFEKKIVTKKVVSTEYNGLIGKFLDAKTETIPGYTPVNTAIPPVDVTTNIPKQSELSIVKQIENTLVSPIEIIPTVASSTTTSIPTVASSTTKASSTVPVPASTEPTPTPTISCTAPQTLDPATNTCI